MQKVSRASGLPADGLVATDPDATGHLVAGGGQVWQTADGNVLVIDPDVDFTCQVLGWDVTPEDFAAALGPWLADSGYVMEGSLPLSRSNATGLFLYGRAEAGGYVTIHVSNLPDDYLGALVTRAERNPTARRLLN
ncbi:hypothetical protein [Oceanibium sediminis]|uniref:hypothetical protein n=1 Tax=Oceanibium sediminis TaxID=2026339 RepID=UPI000DD3D6C3|nr:hypothetical protein [Oceanibium sediminis]